MKLSLHTWAGLAAGQWSSSPAAAIQAFGWNYSCSSFYTLYVVAALDAPSV